MRILRHVLESIAAHARQSSPLESCGILLAEGPASMVVTRVLHAENAAKKPEKEYVVGPKAHIRAVKMECAGIARIVGYYHSHPSGGCKPTKRDRDQAVPGIPYLIARVTNGSPEFAAWRLERDHPTAEPLEVSE